MTSIGNRIREIRGDRTTREFAEILGVTNAIVSLWENGKRNIPERTIKQISEKFSVSEAWLRTGEGEPFIEPDKDQQIEAMVEEIMKQKPEDFRRRFIRALTVLDVDGWMAIEKFIDAINEERTEGTTSADQERLPSDTDDITPEEREMIRQHREKKRRAAASSESLSS